MNTVKIRATTATSMKREVSLANADPVVGRCDHG
jgi:hypothetical protein